MPIHYRPRVLFWNFSDEFQIVLNEQQHISLTAGQSTTAISVQVSSRLYGRTGPPFRGPPFRGSGLGLVLTLADLRNGGPESPK